MSPLVPLTCALLAWADPPPGSSLAVVEALETALGDAIAKDEPSVVAVAREKSEEGEETLAVRGRPREVNPRDPRLGMGRFNLSNPNWLSFDYGSGVIIGNGGEILTAFHVVKGARTLTVRAAGRQSFEAEVIAADPRSDLAVIAPRDLEGVAPPALKPIALGDSTRLRKGSFLLALGNPFNAAWDGSPSASWGILANVARRQVPTEDDANRRSLKLRHYPTLLQLDAKLNLGMSGGAVINLKGELVGITTAAASPAGFDAQAGYAIAMDPMGRRAVEAPAGQGKEVEYGLLGISLDDLGTNKVGTVQPGTPADQAGLLTDDLIVAVDSAPVGDSEALKLAIDSHPPGATVRLKVLRRSELLEKSVELAKFHVDGEVIATNRPAPWRGLRVDYLSVSPVTPFDLGAPAGVAGGVAVAEVEPGSPADKARLKKGQVITHVGGVRVRSPRDFARAAQKPGGPVKLQTDLGRGDGRMSQEEVVRR